MENIGFDEDGIKLINKDEDDNRTPDTSKVDENCLRYPIPQKYNRRYN